VGLVILVVIQSTTEGPLLQLKLSTRPSQFQPDLRQSPRTASPTAPVVTGAAPLTTTSRNGVWDRPKPLDFVPRQLDSWRRMSRLSIPSFENFGAEISAPNCQVGNRAFGTIPNNRHCLIPHFEGLTVFASDPLDRSGAASRNHTWAGPGPGLGTGGPSCGDHCETHGSSSTAASGRASAASSPCVAPGFVVHNASLVTGTRLVRPSGPCPSPPQSQSLLRVGGVVNSSG
jgi:hypothetical protein